MLIVAANRQVREVLNQVFLGAGYTCQVASDGQEGLAVFEAGRTAVVLAELTMPGMAGMPGMDMGPTALWRTAWGFATWALIIAMWWIKVARRF